MHIHASLVQYKYASGASSHLSQGQGSLDFRLANLGHDYWFGFFRGNITNPVSPKKGQERTSYSS